MLEIIKGFSEELVNDNSSECCYLPKPILDDGLKSIEAMRQNREQTPLIGRKQLPRHQ